MGLAGELGNDKQTMYFVFASKPRNKSVSLGNSKITQKKMSKLFSSDYLTIRRNAASEMLEKKGIKKKMMDFDYCGEYLASISSEYVELRKQGWGKHF